MSTASKTPDRLALIKLPRLSPESFPGDSYWSSLKYFSWYRLIVATMFLGAIALTEGGLNLGSENPRLFFWVCVSYLAVGCGSLVVLSRWRHAFNLQLTLQVFADISLLTLLLFASGGAKSGMAMMLLVVLVGAGLVGQGRLVLFYAAIATVALLLEQGYRTLQHGGEATELFSTGITSIGFFGSAIAARLLARRVVANEELARQRGLELADQMRINEQVIRDMPEGVLVIDAIGRVRQSNPLAAELLGYIELPPIPLSDCSPILASEYLNRHDRGVESETVIQMPQSGRTLRARFLPPGEGGNALIFLVDISRLQQEAQQLKLAALGRLTANLAHEIRNPLAAISHAAELMGDEPIPGTERLVRIIGDNTQRLNRLVAEVMELGRRDRASPELIDLHEFLRTVIDELSLPRTPDKVHRIDISLPPTAVIVFDRGHLHRVIGNLLGNALHFASSGAAAVRIIGGVDGSGNRFLLRVIDDGPGIVEAEKNQIFEPFFTTRSSGTGLGLYIARELCEANGARLALLENAPGAHFCISCGTICPDPRKNPI